MIGIYILLAFLAGMGGITIASLIYYVCVIDQEEDKPEMPIEDYGDACKRIQSYWGKHAKELGAHYPYDEHGDKI